MNVSKSSYQSVDGEFDLQSWNFQTQGTISLDGYWALWNEEFIEPLPDSPLPSFSFSYIPYTRAAVALKLRGSLKVWNIPSPHFPAA